MVMGKADGLCEDQVPWEIHVLEKLTSWVLACGVHMLHKLFNKIRTHVHSGRKHCMAQDYIKASSELLISATYLSRCSKI